MEPTRPPTPVGSWIDEITRRVWPRRAQQELLFDLGERKRWRSAARVEAIDRAAAWLTEALGLEPVAAWTSTPAPDLAALRSIGRGLARPPSNGVAAWARGLAPALGVAPKTLANASSSGLRPDRLDHRWLAAIGRVAAGHDALDACVFHRRTAASVAGHLAAAGDSPDATHALLVFSLLALWQRRRPTTDARGNRGRPSSRRGAPKPITQLQGTLISPGQLSALVDLARLIDGGAALVALGLEAALTEAHLGPHRGRVTEAPQSGDAWLAAVDAVLDAPGVPLDELDREVWRYRSMRMRAWRDQLAPTPPSAKVAAVPYVQASERLLVRFRRSGVELEPVDGHGPGVFMLRPQLRSAGLLKEAP